MLADVHGNATALKAVLEDANKNSVTDYISAGDITKRGPSPQECVDLLKNASNEVWIMGNHEKTYHDMINFNDPLTKGPKRVMEIVLNDYDKKHLNKGTYNWLANLPYSQEIQFEGISIQVFHSLPDKPWGHETGPLAKQTYFDRMLDNSNADIAIYGHTHKQVMRYSTKDRLVINPGTVGLATTSGTLEKSNFAQYVILEVNNHNIINVEFKRIAYNIENELKVARERNLPYLELYSTLIKTGQYSYSVENIESVNKKANFDELSNTLLK
ncbi:diadenosine tetraphosphatase-like protein [Liquorilactobacillus uvarum DSM 19971]|uniref:Diadenosine tetraphosphatase-like protein n=1 Tax=Liquorilactobacillus uvarum DSM 19971 TaxID=1423812 RepID=A0A0R1PXJ0_9LACO|nr:diadenosine tetraphosphatase-like protein [Liquorilactobacillus uvarum DSM 19971]